jgi:predicted nucleic acid-binding Zn finger protein
MRATATVLARVEDQRFSKAAEGIRNGTYHTTVTLQTEEEVRGFVVKKGHDKEYGCTITTAGAFCSCPDALYRGSICKHAVALALYVIRNPLRDPAAQARTQPEQRP